MMGNPVDDAIKPGGSTQTFSKPSRKLEDGPKICLRRDEAVEGRVAQISDEVGLMGTSYLPGINQSGWPH